MSEPFLGEIRVVGFDFAPTGWALCNGQILPISQNAALFSLLRTQFGGNGTSTFALPNLQGYAPMDQGNGIGLSPRVIGETGGEANVTLLGIQMPSHTHPPADSTTSNAASPANAIFGGGGRGKQPAYGTTAPNSQMNVQAIGFTGGNQPHNNMPPYLTMNFIIALQGIFPSRS